MGGGSGREVEVGGGRWEREEGKGRAVGTVVGWGWRYGAHRILTVW